MIIANVTPPFPLLLYGQHFPLILIRGLFVCRVIFMHFPNIDIARVWLGTVQKMNTSIHKYMLSMLFRCSFFGVRFHHTPSYIGDWQTHKHHLIYVYPSPRFKIWFHIFGVHSNFAYLCLFQVKLWLYHHYRSWV